MDYVNNYLAEHGDERTKDWPLVRNVWTVFIVMSIYLVLIFDTLPKYMANRKPYSLKGFLLLYNSFQTVMSFVAFWGMFNSGWLSGRIKLWGCNPCDEEDPDESLSMAKWCYRLHLLKLIELSETCIFILRKKERQVSVLHIHHHTFVYVMSFVSVRLIPGGNVTFLPMVNLLVHFLMYFYYLLSLMGAEMQHRLRPWKERLTMLQISQFLVMIVYAMQVYACQSANHYVIFMAFLPNLLFILYGFYNFYKTHYAKNKIQH